MMNLAKGHGGVYWMTVVFQTESISKFAKTRKNKISPSAALTSGEPSLTRILSVLCTPSTARQALCDMQEPQ